MSDHRNLPRPGGESGNQVAVRALAVLEEISASHPDEHVLAVTHGGTINNVLFWLNLLLPEHGHIGNTSMTRLIHQPNSEAAPWSLDVFNLLAHLTPAEVTDNQEG
jgi:broad specificity phosphatase PhoE